MYYLPPATNNRACTLLPSIGATGQQGIQGLVGATGPTGDEAFILSLPRSHTTYTIYPLPLLIVHVPCYHP